MELSYRGLHYNFTPAPSEVSLGKVGGQYRGCDWRFRHLTKPPVQGPTLNLFYRGVAYPPQSAPPRAPVQAGVTHEEVAPQPALSAEQMARVLMMNHHRWVRDRQRAMLERGSEEIGLKGVDSSYWTPIQGKVQSAFWASYDRSPVAMS